MPQYITTRSWCMQGGVKVNPLMRIYAKDICTIGNYKASGPRMVLYNVIYHIPIFYFANFIVFNEINTFVVIICFFVFFFIYNILILDYFPFNLCYNA